ncbi:MAG TPA: dockerin type I domain-containing protein [Fimbriimonadaceae bacterium]|nr:dockerin type I domain-containing protein [Fimbriimonadaceae bacterium]HRJ95416.1 dockerin type I domain-containing protein [Fimbriimonadaceae bacterium]
MLHRQLVLATTLIAVCTLPAIGQVTLTDLGRVLGNNQPLVTGASRDLETFAGTNLYGGDGFYWHEGQFHLLEIPGNSMVIPRGVSATGDRFAVATSTSQGATASHLWDRGGSRVQIGGTGDPVVYAISPDGQVAYSEQHYWSNGSGWQLLDPVLYTGNLGRGLVTEDGRLVAQQWPVIGLWSPGTGFVPIVTVQSSGSVNLHGVSPNGTHLVGFRTTTFGDLARVWPAGGPPFDLGFGLSGPSRATSASRDGKVIVGWQTMPIFGPDPFLWSATTGKIALRDYLASNGVDEAYNWRFNEDLDGIPSSPWISADGRTIIGFGRYGSESPSFWMARIGDITDTGPATVSGRVEFRELLPEATLPSSVTFEFLDLASRAVVRSIPVPLDAHGRFTAVGPAQDGPYAFSLKHTHWLRRSVDIDTSNGNVNGILLRLTNGDVDEDNEIAVGDYAILSASFGSSPGDPGWVENADLNGDEEVTIADYAVLSQNFGLVGDD